MGPACLSTQDLSFSFLSDTSPGLPRRCSGAADLSLAKRPEIDVKQ